MEAFRVHVKPLENSVWNLQTIFVFRLFKNNAASIYKDKAFQVILALFSFLESITLYPSRERNMVFLRLFSTTREELNQPPGDSKILEKTVFSSVMYPS